MALVHIPSNSLCKLAGIKPADIEPMLTSLGIPLEAQEGDDLSLEITPNRPDWLSVEGVARSISAYKTAKPKIYSALSPHVHFIIDDSVREVRPYFGTAIVRGLVIDEEILTSLIQLQEKLHDTLGRGRKKMAIGLHDLSAVQPPFTYKAVGREDVRFVPLGHSTPMSCGQILLEHDKGRAFAHLVGDRCPLIVDKNGEVLSFPPIINGERTRVGLSSTDLLIDCTGTSEQAVRVVVNILCAALADRGGKVEEVYVGDKPYSVFKPHVQPLPLAGARKLLGVDMDAPAVIRHLARLGHSATPRQVSSPAFRSDIIGEADLIEDIAISIGYNNLPMPLPPNGLAGTLEDHFDSLHESALALGYFEVMSWILTNQSVLERSKAPGARLKVSNPLTEEFTTLRPWLYANLMEILSRSKSQPLPIHLYEVGPVVRAMDETAEAREAPDFIQTDHFTAVSMHPKACFSEEWSNLLAISSAFKTPLTLRPEDLPGFIPGRSAKLVLGERVVGLIGEIHPSVLEAFGLEQPVALFELDADAFSSVQKDFKKKD